MTGVAHHRVPGDAIGDLEGPVGQDDPQAAVDDHEGLGEHVGEGLVHAILREGRGGRARGAAKGDG
jgi:hypothetical protein